MKFDRPTYGRRVAAAAVAGMIAVALAACTPGNAAGSPAESAGASPAAAEIDPNAILKLAMSAPSRTFDPALMKSYAESGYLGLTFDRLVMLDKDDNLIPGLATEWEFKDGGKTLSLTLRDGVTFHDGTPFDADAVKANIERNQTMEGSTLKSALAPIASVTVVDDTHVDLGLQGSGVSLPSLFATNAGMMVSPKALADPTTDLDHNPGDAGSGPYIISDFIPGESFKARKADGEYWDPEAGRLGGIDFTLTEDGTTRVRGVQTGQIDLSTANAAPNIVEALKLADEGAIQINTKLAKSTLGFYIRSTQGDLANPEIRQALAYAIDRDSINQLFSGNCTPSTQLYPVDSPWAIPDYEFPYQFDLDKAKSLLEKNGGASITLNYPGGGNVEQPANVLQSQLSEAGFDLTLNPVPLAEAEPRFIAGDFEILLSQSFNAAIDPADTFNKYFSPTGTYKVGIDPEITEMVQAADVAADATLPDDQRAPLYQDLYSQINDQAWYIPVCNVTQATIAGPKVVGYDNVPWMNIGIMDLRYIAMTK